ncbi:FGGY carbohydrate kinase domain-containing protein isoform X2 [Belonocnema kinseyi]|nr:FGGY carbohydrate kinase domain-containing protein isoform X2 [Belonocnema kinseyi]XP_033226388.1 FGGY carbohydrate kinase domain-containing protein isoform X2 [Belonocnema kinseyi]
MALCYAVKKVVASVPKESIKGIGFAATCSLVVIDKDESPVTVSPSGNDEQNIILWMDHRAELEAELINSTNHKVLKYVGGKISLEMQAPKMIWLKNHMPGSWARAKLLFDLPDFLTWKATGSESRSLCSLVCKWNYVASPKENGWNSDFFDTIGLSDLKENNWKRIGSVIKAPGEPVGSGLSKQAAAELNLLQGTPVGTSVIDAHAGGLGMLGCDSPDLSTELTSRLGLICGTSTCHMAVSQKEIFIDGVWGPYYSAMFPGLWLSEGGQSATGKLIDHIIDTHPATFEIYGKLEEKWHIQQYLHNLLKTMARKENLLNESYLTKDLHVWPDFHGNRSPLADPTLRGMISGLSLSSDEESLAKLYLATLQAITYGTKHIIEALTLAGHKIEVVLICGGLSRSELFVQTQADVLGLPVLIPAEKEPVMLGAAILGASAGKYSSIQSAIKAMKSLSNIVKPKAESYPFHSQKYRVFKKMVEDQKSYKRLMDQDL